MAESTVTVPPTMERDYKKSTVLITFILCFLSLLSFGIWSSVLPYTMTALKTAFQLTSAQTGSLSSFFVIGSVLGAFVGGWASDKFGRKATLVFSIIFSSIVFCALGFTTNYYQFSFLILLASLGLGGVYIVPNVLLAEVVPEKFRTTAMASLMVGYSAGAILTAFVAGQLVEQFGWEKLYQFCLIPVVIALIVQLLCKESEAWLKNRNLGKKEAAESKVSLKTFIKDKKTLNILIFWTLCSGTLHFGFYGVSSWLPAYFEQGLNISYKDMTFIMMLTYGVASLTKIASGLIGDRIGPKRIYVIGCIGTAIMIATLVFFNASFNSIALVIIFSLFYGIPFGIIGAYMAESFPTAIRGTAIGLTMTLGAVAAPLAPLMVGYYSDMNSIDTGMLILGVTYFLSGVIALLFIKDRLFNPSKGE